MTSQEHNPIPVGPPITSGEIEKAMGQMWEGKPAILTWYNDYCFKCGKSIKNPDELGEHEGHELLSHETGVSKEDIGWVNAVMGAGKLSMKKTFWDKWRDFLDDPRNMEKAIFVDFVVVGMLAVGVIIIFVVKAIQ